MPQQLSYRALFSQWLPLATSMTLLVFEPAFVNIGLGHMPNPELGLAAFGVAYGLAVLLEAPVLMLLDVSSACVSDRMTLGLLRRLALVLGFAIAGSGVAIALSPLYDILVEQIMRIPADVAFRTRPTLSILALWAIVVALRRAQTGGLVRGGKSSVVGAATMVRLGLDAIVLFIGLSLFPGEAPVVASVALVFAAAAETTVVTVAASKVASRVTGDSAGGKVFTRLSDLWDFYRPLSLAGFLTQVSRSLVNSGIAMASMARTSLAGYSVVWGFVNSSASPTMCLQQLTTIYAKTGAYVRVRNFTLFLSGLLSGLLLLVVATPLSGWVLGSMYNLTPELQDMARPGMAVFIPYPLVAGIANLMRGILIARGQTHVVRAATSLNVLALCMTLGAGLVFFSMNGVVLGAAAMVMGMSAELAWLTYNKLHLTHPFLATEPILEGHVAAGE